MVMRLKSLIFSFVKCLIRIPLIPGFNTEYDRKKSETMLSGMGFKRFDKFEYKTDINK